MPLRVELAPGEQVYIGKTLVTNGKLRAALYLEGSQPILKQKDIIAEKDADTVCKRIYVAITEGYLADNAFEADHKFIELAKKLANAAPSCKILLDAVSSLVLVGEHYKALKLCRQLIEHEALLLACVTGVPLPISSVRQ